MPDFSYTPDLLAQLAAQIRAARSTGLPWMVDNAQRGYDYARANGANLTFDEYGNPLPDTQPLPELPPEHTAAIAETLAAVRGADPAVFQPPPQQDSQYDIDQMIQQLAAQQPGPSGGATSDTPPADVPPSLGTDPAYLAFQRALGAERATAGRNAQDQVDETNRGVALRLPQIAESGTRAREGLSGSYETRGLLRSGQHEESLARQRQSEANLTSGVQSDAANRVAAIRQALAQSEAGFDSRAAEANLAAGQRQQDFTANQTAQQRQQDGLAALLAAQQRSNDAISARYDTAIRTYGVGGGPGATTPTPATSSNPLAGLVGIVPQSGDPDYARRLAELRRQQGQ